MGIDIYAKWRGQTEAETAAQFGGFNTTIGHTGYLREAYHGAPYATKALLPELWEAAGDGSAKIPAAKLRERLPEVLKVVEQREKLLYNGSDEDVAAIQKSFTDFVELCERKEKELGEPCEIIGSY